MRWLPFAVWGRLRRLRWLYPYMFAHKPLCGRFHGEVLRVGPVRLCRSCSVLYTAAGGVAAVGVAGSMDAHAALAALAGLLPFVLLGSRPGRYAGRARRSRDVLRAATGACIGLVIVVAATAPWIAAALAGSGWLMQRFYARVRARIASDPCAGCPELQTPGVCSGFADQARAMRAFEAELEQRIMADLGDPPDPFGQQPRGSPADSEATPAR